jgi:hypothetical protein
MPRRARPGSGRRPKPAKMGQREWKTCFTVTAFGVIGLYKPVMTLGDDPDLLTVTGLATVIEGDNLQVCIHSVPCLALPCALSLHTSHSGCFIVVPSVVKVCLAAWRLSP